MATEADKIAAAIDFEFDAYNPKTKKKMLEKNKKKVDVREQLKNNSDQVKTGREMELKVTKGCQEYVSRKLREYLNETLEFVDTMSDHKDVPEKNVQGGVKLLASSESYLTIPTESSGENNSESSSGQKKLKKRKHKTIGKETQLKLKEKRKKMCGIKDSAIDLASVVVDGFDIINGGHDVFKKINK